MSDLSKVKSSDLSTRSYSPLFRLRLVWLQMECSYIALLREFCYVENLSTSIIFSVIFFQRKKSQLILSHVEVQIKQFKTLNWNTWMRHVCRNVYHVMIYIRVYWHQFSVSLVFAMVRGFSLSLFSLLSLLHAGLAGAGSCCLTKVVQGNDNLAGTYSLYTGAASFLPSCMWILLYSLYSLLHNLT